ncbi:MAG TPA: hypothetical protein ENJ35_04180 [Gammaproteobacteria bacterium]|nr:hypothetical protein [Gammaproteobacteria bacterium]
MHILRANTAVIVQFGPGVDATDGVTLETGLATAMDNATTGIRVSKNGAVMVDRNSATVPAYDAMGFYRVALSATDTNTEGRLKIIFEEAATCLPIWADFQVVNEAIYDSLYSGSPSAIIGSADGSGTTSTILTAMESTYTINDALVGRVLIFDGNVTAALKGQAGTITAYNGSTGLITFASSEFTTGSVSGDTFKIY